MTETDSWATERARNLRPRDARGRFVARSGAKPRVARRRPGVTPRCVGPRAITAVARYARPVRRVPDDLSAELVRVLHRRLSHPGQHRGEGDGRRRSARTATPAAATCAGRAPLPSCDAVGR